MPNEVPQFTKTVVPVELTPINYQLANGLEITLTDHRGMIIISTGNEQITLSVHQLEDVISALTDMQSEIAAE